jgi:hypothetical protein
MLSAEVDTASDYIVLDPALAGSLGVSLPSPRQMPVGGAGGFSWMLSFPPDGQVALFVTDYREFCYLPASLVGFHPPPPLGTPPASLRSVLGLTGFLQHFQQTLDPAPTPPMLELDPIASFPGQSGMLPRTIPLTDFIRSLRAGS